MFILMHVTFSHAGAKVVVFADIQALFASES